jgi:hypothetical protein
MIKKQVKTKLQEKDISHYFLSVAEMYLFYCFRTNNNTIKAGKFMKMPAHKKGHPDAVILNARGETFYIEFKSSTGKLSEFQIYQQKKIEGNKGKYIVISSILDCTDFFAINR